MIVKVQGTELRDIRRNFVCERCGNGTASAPQTIASSQSKTFETSSSSCRPHFQVESLHKPNTSSQVVNPSQQTFQHLSSQQRDVTQKSQSAATVTQPAQSRILTTSRPSDPIVTHTPTVILPPPLPEVSASTEDLDSGPEELDGSIEFNNNVKKELDVETVHELFHNNTIGCVKFCQDGKYLVAGCRDGKAYIYNVQTGSLTR